MPLKFTLGLVKPLGHLKIASFHLQEGERDHDGDGDVIAAGQLAAKMEETIEADPSKPVKRVYNKVVIDSNLDAEDIPDFHRIRARLQRSRATLVPPIPHDVEDARIEGEWAET